MSGRNYQASFVLEVAFSTGVSTRIVIRNLTFDMVASMYLLRATCNEFEGKWTLVPSYNLMNLLLDRNQPDEIRRLASCINLQNSMVRRLTMLAGTKAYELFNANDLQLETSPLMKKVGKLDDYVQPVKSEDFELVVAGYRPEN